MKGSGSRQGSLSALVALLIALCWSGAARGAAPEASDESVVEAAPGPEEAEEKGALDRLAESFSHPELRLGLVAQAMAQVRPEREETNGFLVRAARLQLHGELQGGWRYFFQTEFVRAPALLDLLLGWGPNRALVLQAGYFRVPFGWELAVNLPALPFIYRARVVQELVPGRQVGAAVMGEVAEGLLTYGLGVFNGNGAQFLGNDDNAPLVTGRLSVAPPLGDAAVLLIGASGAWQRDDTEALQQDTILAGADAHLEVSRLTLGGEVVVSQRFEEGAEFPAGEAPWGHQLTASLVAVPETLWVLARWDSFQPEDPNERSDLVILGVNARPADSVLLRLNYQIPLERPALQNHWLRLNVQFAF